MHKVKLYTARYQIQLATDGTETRVLQPDGYVASVQMPPFVLPPEVISWGARTFVFHSTNIAAGHHVYVEACLWVAITAFMDEGTSDTPDVPA